MKAVLTAALFAALLAGFITLMPLSRYSISGQLDTLITREPLQTTRPNTAIGTIAHRGASAFAPENTLAAIEKAIGMSFDYVELEIGVSRDGVPVVVHDKTVDRTTDGSGAVHTLDWDELRQLDAGSWFDPRFRGERIPSLEEALAVMQGRICAYWDTKAYATREIIDLFRRYGFDRDCLLITFGGLGSGGDERVVRRLLQLWPDAPIVPLVKQPDEVQIALRDYPQARGVQMMWWFATAEMVDRAHAAGALVITSTLTQHDVASRHRKVMEAGADYFMLDNKPEFDAERAALIAIAADD